MSHWYKCYGCGDEHSTDNVCAVCIRCFSFIKAKPAEALRMLEIYRKALREHECPGDGSIDQICSVRIVGNGLKCTATEALAATTEAVK